jgi:hypothetical protein
VTTGADPLFPRLSYENSLEISLQRKINIDLWDKGKPYPSALAKKLQLTGRHRKAADNPATKRIVAEKAKLRKEIARSSKLVEDFEFFLGKMDWYPELLLQQLYWDSNMMHADPQTVLAKQKKSTWPISRETLIEIRENVRVLAEQVERLSKTDFSPARTVILCDADGRRLHRADEKYLLRAFRNLPDILSFYASELGRKLSLASGYWSREAKEWKSLVELARQNSLYERIRAKTGQYHTVRLHRLVNASRLTRGLRAIKQRAFIIWLNRLKKRHEAKLTSAAMSQSQEGSPPPQLS